jgi:hypothetical protein
LAMLAVPVPWYRGILETISFIAEAFA